MVFELKRRPPLLLPWGIGVVALIFSMSMSAQAHGQAAGGMILGTASDETNAVLPGVTVQATNVSTGITRETVTDAAGNYRLAALPVGEYEVESRLMGFQTTVRTGIVLTVGREAVVPFVMGIGELEQRIVVVGEAPLVETTTSEQGGVVDEKRIQALPVYNRAFENLAFFEPGVSLYTSGNSSEKMIISGSRPNTISVYMDGTDIQGAGNTVGNNRLGVEALEEFRVLTHNYSAAFGKTSGGVIETVSKSGTNTFKGSVYEYLRNDKLDAKGFFDPPNSPKPPFTRHQFGIAVGGPLVRDRSHFFGNYEGLRQTLGRRVLSAVPDANARQGLLPDRNNPGQFINVGVKPSIRPFLDLYPLPNGRDFGDGTGEYGWFYSEPTTEDYATARLDHVFSTSDSMFVRYTINPSDSTSARPLPGFISYGKGRDQLLTVEHKKLISPKWMNIARASIVRSNSESDSIPESPLDSSLSFMPGQSFGTIAVRSLNELGVATTAPRTELDMSLQLDEELSHARGKHFLKLGFTFRKYSIDVVSGSTGRGIYDFNTLSDFLQGTAVTYRSSFPDSDVNRRYRQMLAGWYVQDDLQLLSNLTVNLGLRHEVISSPTEVDGKMSTMRSNLDPEVTLITKDEPYYKPNPSLKNFAPRVGFAWDVFRNGKTAVRGGYGLYYNQMVGFYYTLWAARTPPFYLEGLVRNPARFPDAYLDLDINRVNIETIAPTHTPTVKQFGLSVQHQLGATWVVALGYVGSRGNYLERNFEGNLRLHEVLPDGRIFYPVGSPYINPNFNNIRIRRTDASSWYNSLQSSVQKRFRAGAQLQVSYTWAKNMDNASSTQGHQVADTSERNTMNPWDLNQDKGLSAMHVGHTFTVNGMYELPFGRDLTGMSKLILGGWGINGIATLQSGIPFSAVLGFSQSRDGVTDNPADRPNLRSGADSNPILGGPDRYFDPSVFELPEAGTYGNLGRHTLLSPGIAKIDLVLVKDFALGGSKEISFRAEFFNVANRANFGAPYRRVLDTRGNVVARAGRISNTSTTMRQIQLGLRLEF